jgi:hypothetical protein
MSWLRSPAATARAAAEDHRPGGAVELGDRHHDGGLDRQQPAVAGLPLLQGLELDRLGRDVGHVEPREQRLGSARVVVGGSADQREAGERQHGIDDRPAVLEEEALDGRPRIEPGGEGRDHPQAPRLERGDHPVIVAGIAGQQVGAHQQQADGPGLAAALAIPRQAVGAFGEPPFAMRG